MHLRSLRYLAWVTILTFATVPAFAGIMGPVPEPTNVLQDCWTTDIDKDPDVELELNAFTTDDSINFVWKHKLLVSCSSYRYSIYGFACTDGKPRLRDVFPFSWSFTNVPLGPISPIPGIPELIFSHTAPADSIPPGRWDWAIAVECDDTDMLVHLDGDIDDECGVNMGEVLGGPLFMGPEPIERWDAHPGGTPPGRGPGESGETRPWCFDVFPAAPPPPPPPPPPPTPTPMLGTTLAPVPVDGERGSQ